MGEKFSVAKTELIQGCQIPNGREEIFTSKKIQFSSDVSKKDKKGLVYFFFIFEFKDKK